MEKWLNYDQISLIPTRVSTLEHRAEADTSVQFGPVKLQVPIIAAPMPDVSNGEMALELSDLGSLGWIHRFQTLEDQKKAQLAIGHMKFHESYYAEAGIAIGLKDFSSVEFFYPGYKIFCLDTANGASTMVERAVKTLKDKYPDIFIITGNVASAEAFYALESWGADAIRVGIAGGSVCETRTETGVYSPMATAIANIKHYVSMYDEPLPNPIPVGWANIEGMGIARPRKALLIADGGIRTPSDMCKALALGADVVMMGGALAGTEESPGQVIKDRDGKKYKILRGAASFGVQKEAGAKDIDYNEGAETFVPYIGSVEKVINRFAAGLRSSMSYMNARNLTEYRSNVKIVEAG